ncbi:hypothetical protein FIBSPDRAFT_930740 [Athelia psychrophila]|uniref:ATP-dependent RNA helicase n=1 Tax=Athelia psychrophila TaxID=1759441 RepID=A0A166LIP2_9AGAM|nr:hypothetical protein FIBSPDRAFT_930740 [Fibularhizoctonia sp. CBS 109695]
MSPRGLSSSMSRKNSSQRLWRRHLILWYPYGLNSHLHRSPHRPTSSSLRPPIQSRALPATLSGCDVVGMVETGSGKTLAYDLPILHHILSQTNSSKKTKRQLNALILALQVAAHLTLRLQAQAPQNDTDENEDEDEGRGGAGGERAKGRPARDHRHDRVRDVCAEAVARARPRRRSPRRGARARDILENDDELVKQIRGLEFLVVNEADRMVEAGHFKELEHILQSASGETGRVLALFASHLTPSDI